MREFILKKGNPALGRVECLPSQSVVQDRQCACSNLSFILRTPHPKSHRRLYFSCTIWLVFSEWLIAHISIPFQRNSGWLKKYLNFSCDSHMKGLCIFNIFSDNFVFRAITRRHFLLKESFLFSPKELISGKQSSPKYPVDFCEVLVGLQCSKGASMPSFWDGVYQLLHDIYGRLVAFGNESLGKTQLGRDNRLVNVEWVLAIFSEREITNHELI